MVLSKVLDKDGEGKAGIPRHQPEGVTNQPVRPKIAYKKRKGLVPPSRNHPIRHPNLLVDFASSRCRLQRRAHRGRPFGGCQSRGSIFT